MFNKISNTDLLIFSLVVVIIAAWSFKLTMFPGLHADEAWFGIRANEINIDGTFRWHGMNHYTGAFQEMLSAASFKIAGKGIFQLRAAGLLCNIIALIFLLRSLRTLIPNRWITIYFILLLAQSIVWLVYPRIAWEVTSLTLLFFSLSFWSTLHILKGSNSIYCLFSFFCVHLIGSYNHIIFASIPLSILITILIFGFITSTLNTKLITLSSLNMVNIAVLFFMMNYRDGFFFEDHLGPSILILIALVISESLIGRNWKFDEIHTNNFNSGKYAVLFKTCLILGVGIFIWNHGLAFFAYLCNVKILKHIYSYEYSFLTAIFNIAFVLILLYCILIRSIIDFRYNKLPLIFVLSYLSIFSLFTTANSPRYYLCISLLFYLYSAYSIYKYPINSRFKIAILILAVFVSQGQLWKIYTDLNYKFIPKYVSFGKTEEPSYHFFPIQPVIDILQFRQIETVETISNDYFIKIPIQFMENIKPWKKRMGSKVLIDYGENGDNGGFIILEKD
ncbi:hypothetical protein [Sphingobacterium sp.]|uniref:hypothetical protein n=1 Tax=Sphingobacterium sp. TaxID=341027 RepID=UPI0031D2C790